MFERLTTEQQNEATKHLDEMSIMDILKVINQEDKLVPTAVETQLGQIEKAIDLIVNSFNNNGRLIYIGAGTSGRMGVLDAVECPPTFGTEPEMVQGIIAGGNGAIIKAVEGAEDNEKLAAADLKAIKLGTTDTVIGVAASGRTPYVLGGLSYAQQIGASTVAISCNKSADISKYAKVAIEVPVGPEILTGSTRLKAGTAQKLVLNMISTGSMIGIGKVYGNLMVDLQPTNEKLIERSKRIIMLSTGVPYEKAEYYFKKANKRSKAAIVMIENKCSYEEAIKSLADANGFVRKAIRSEKIDS
ncbi:N-acetylmuramic acid 6-phosphate etherase [Bacillaceae bacterium Marseille-Q3522]|nr:N-acetylmuramic acid 6-phosphate etherase [Bacillaceae bacterium Marseille-Q3522]